MIYSNFWRQRHNGNNAGQQTHVKMYIYICYILCLCTLMCLVVEPPTPKIWTSLGPSTKWSSWRVPQNWVWALYYHLSMVIKKCEHDYIIHQTARGTTFSDRPELNSEAKHNLTWLQPQDRITLGTFRDARSWARNQKAIPKCIVPELCCTRLIHQ